MSKIVKNLVRYITKAGIVKTYEYERRIMGNRLTNEQREQIAEHSKSHLVDETAAAFSISSRTVRRIRRERGIIYEPFTLPTTYYAKLHNPNRRRLAALA